MSVEDLIRMNVELGDAEKDGDLRFFQARLHDELLFRRSTGALVGKMAFMDGLAGLEYDVLRAENVELVDQRESSAVVTLDVLARGASARGTFQGRYHNVRVFVPRGDDWQLRAWVNWRTGDFAG